jgi:proteasome accessory factor A
MSARIQPVRVPKILGADVELGNFIDGLDTPAGSGGVASRVLLAQIPGVPANVERNGGSSSYDCGRRFLPGNGGCAYVDLDHLELALPETRCAFDFVIYWRAMLEIAQGAVVRANRMLPAGHRVHALANCSDGHGHSYGAHMSVLLTRAAYDNLIRRKPHYLAFLAAFQTSSIVFSGAGKAGAENGRPWADFQLSQRADFLEVLSGEQTTCNRPLVNSRDEPLSGRSAARPAGDAELARLHVIFFDATLCQVATLLRAGTLQVVAAMIEAEAVDPHMALDDPLEALARWSRDATLDSAVPLVDGTRVTALELQQRFLERARTFAVSHGFEGIVPRAGEILDVWEDTLGLLRRKDFPALARRLDWALKRTMLERAIEGRPSLAWSSPEVRHLDQLYASIDPEEGLFWACERAGLVDTSARPERIRRAVEEPPADTRAWTRAHLLRVAGAGRIEEIDWDAIGVRMVTGRHGYAWSENQVVHLHSPYGAGRAENERAFTGDPSLEYVVASLQAGSTDEMASRSIVASGLGRTSGGAADCR